MKLKNIITGSLLFILFAVSQNSAQTTPGEFDKQQRIYESLEYNTVAFSDLKQKWVISDPLLVREIYNRFLVHNALRINGMNITAAILKEKTNSIYDSKVVVDLRKRYYDDEIEFFAFIPENELQSAKPNYLFDPIKDGYLLKDIVGDKVYEKIKTQGYFYSSLTKTNFDAKSGYFYDIYLNALEPHLMFWNTTSSNRNKYLASVFGKWGNDKIMLPGWYSDEYVVGGALTYYQSISNDLSKYLYDIRIGTALGAGYPFRGGIAPRDHLKNTGQSIYLRASGDILKYLIDGADGYCLTLEVKYSLDEKRARDFNVSETDTIFSVRDYATLSLNVPEIANLGDLGFLEIGGGISTSDIYRYQANSKISSKLIDLEKDKSWGNKFSHNVFVNFGVSRSGGLIQHHIWTMFTYNTTGYGVVGVGGQVMLGEQFGVDLRVMKSFGLDQKKEPWRPDTYIVFSPILRINY
jgi:uncharacterized protein YutD